jgi:hypothetical protein
MFSQDLADTTYAPWPGGFVDAARLAMSRVFPLVILLPGDVDIVGHLDGADSEEYRAAVRRVDDLLAASLPDFDFERDTLAIVADHGHVDGGGHGGVEDQVLEVPLILAGAGIDRDGLVTGARLIDVAPTVAALLGLPAPRHGLGRTLVSALDVPTETRRRIAEADTIRVSANQALLDASTQLARVYVAANRLRRVFLSISLAALAVVLLVVARRLGAVTIDWRVLLIALPAFPLAFYALLDMAGGNFSLSALPDEGVGARRVYYLGLASTGVHVLAAWIALRGRVVLRDRLAAANAIALCGMLVAGLPAALAWALYGAGPFVELPGPRMIFLIPAMYIAVSCYAVAAAATLGLEVVVFFARAVDPRQRLRRLERAMKKERIRLSSEIDLPIARDAPESGDSEPG